MDINCISNNYIIYKNTELNTLQFFVHNITGSTVYTKCIVHVAYKINLDVPDLGLKFCFIY